MSAANLYNTDLTGVDLTGVLLSRPTCGGMRNGATLTGADARRRMTKAQLLMASSTMPTLKARSSYRSAILVPADV